MDVALEHFGVAHATTTLARGNLVDALDQLGERDAARQLLADSIEAIKKVTCYITVITNAVAPDQDVHGFCYWQCRT
jgi:hypothetical protein